MAKVIITINDEDEGAGAIHLNYTFDPELPRPATAAEVAEIPLTPAQTLALHFFQHVQDAVQAANDEANEEQTTSGEDAGEKETCAQNGEDTCCGGNCHVPAAVISEIEQDDPFAGETLTPRPCSVEDPSCDSCQ